MISKKLLSRSLCSLYKELLVEENRNEDNDSLIKEIYLVAADSRIFSNNEIKENKEKLRQIEKAFTHRDFICYTDGAVLVEYENDELKTGKKISAGASFIIKQENKVLFEDYFSIPSIYGNKDTNSHIAEYQGLISCLEKLSASHPMTKIVKVKVYSDSQVMVRQMNLEYRVRDDEQRKLRDEALELIAQFKEVKITHIDRTKNKWADLLAKKSIEMNGG